MARCFALIRRELLAILLLTLLGSVALSRAAAGVPDLLNEEERAWLARHGSIVFVSQSLYPPFEFLEEGGERSGMCIELARWIATELGFRAVFRDMSFKEAQQAVLAGEADVLTSLFYSKERDQRFDFSEMTWEVPALIFVRAGRPDIVRVGDLRGKRIAMQRGDYAAEFLRGQGVEFAPVDTATFAEAVDQVIAGHADAVIGDQQIVLHHIFSRGLTGQIQSVGEALYIGRNAMAAAEGQRELVSILNKGLALARERGVFDAIGRKWLGTRYAPEANLLQKYSGLLLIIAGLVLLAVVTVVLWNARLRRAVAQRTAELQQSEARYRFFIESLPVGVYQRTVGEENRLVMVNPALLNMLEYNDPEQLMASGSGATYIRPEQGHRLNTLLREQGHVEAFEAELRTGKGRVIRVHIWARIIGAGDAQHVEGVMIDMTEALLAEEQRRRLAAAVEQASETVVITDLGGTILYANSAFERTSGYTRAEALGGNPRLLKSGEHDEIFYRQMWQTLAAGRTWEGRLVNRRKDGSLFTEDVTISPLRDDSGTVINYVAVKRDVSREIALEQQLRQAQKMEALGQLTGGVAHDFNNLLQVINGHADLALIDLPAHSPLREHLEEINRAGVRAAQLVGQLLVFSRRQIMRLEPLEPNAVIADCISMLKRVISEHIRLVFSPGLGIGTVLGDRGMLEQILLNLCVNARDAMPEGGELSISTEDVNLTAQEVEVYPGVLPGRYLRLSVHDTGCGMEQSVVEHIFEPFFTTKPVGKGTGLGLATVYGIVCQHNGMIRVASNPGQGSTFLLYLPVNEETAVQTAQSMREKETAGGSETVLLAEDDDMVRNLTSNVLEHAGYRVLCAGDGQEAVEMFFRHAAEVDLLLFDVVMPRLGGPQAVEQILARRPELPVIFASGYAEDAIHTDYVLDSGITLLSKPFVIEELLRTVRGKLDAAPAAAAP